MVSFLAERVKSGIPGLDKLIGGGYPRDSVILLSGGPGTGKTTFALQYIYYGAKHNEPGLYVTFEQEPEHLKSSMKQFGMDLDKLEKQKKLAIVRIKNVRDLTEIMKIIKTNVKKLKAKRLVIDSFSSMEIFASTFRSMIKDFPTGVIERRIPLLPPPQAVIRRLMYKMIQFFKELHLTVLLISESNGEEYSRYGIAEFVCDGIIKLEATVIGKSLQRSIVVIKLRETKIDGGRYGVDITEKGIKVLNL